MIGDEFTGIYTDGKPLSINGCGFPDIQPNEDIRSVFHVDDIVRYSTGREFRVTFVDEFTVKMAIVSESAK